MISLMFSFWTNMLTTQDLIKVVMSSKNQLDVSLFGDNMSVAVREGADPESGLKSHTSPSDLLGTASEVQVCL